MCEDTDIPDQEDNPPVVLEVEYKLAYFAHPPIIEKMKSKKRRDPVHMSAFHKNERMKKRRKGALSRRYGN